MPRGEALMPTRFAGGGHPARVSHETRGSDRPTRQARWLWTPPSHPEQNRALTSCRQRWYNPPGLLSEVMHTLLFSTEVARGGTRRVSRVFGEPERGVQLRGVATPRSRARVGAESWRCSPPGGSLRKARERYRARAGAGRPEGRSLAGQSGRCCHVILRVTNHAGLYPRWLPDVRARREGRYGVVGPLGAAWCRASGSSGPT